MSINQQVTALVKQKYGPAGRQLAAQAPREANWFAQYQQTIQNAAAQLAAANQAAVAGIGVLQQGVNNSAAQQWAGQQAAMSQDAGVRGAQVNPGLADIAHNAADVRGNITGTYGGYLASTGQNQQNYLANRGTVAAQQGLEAHQRNQGARKELATQKGEYAATTKQQLVADAQAVAQKAADDAFNRYVQQSRLSISQQSADNSASLGQARLGIEQQNANTASRRAARAAKTSPGTAKDAYGNTRIQRRGAQDAFDRALNIAKAAAGPGEDEQTLVDYLVQKKNVSVVDARAAAQAAMHNGRLGPKTGKRLARRGVSKFPTPRPPQPKGSLLHQVTG